MGRKIQIVEVGPRDGLQSEPGVVPTAAKIEFIEQLFDAGLRRIEVTSFVNPKKVPQMADAEAVLSGLRRREGVHFIGLVLNRRGYERAAAAGCNEIGMAVVASDTFNRRNQGVSTEESIAAWLEIAREANAAGLRPTITIGASFGCPFEGEMPVERVIDIARRVAEAGPYEIAFADTIGVCLLRSQRSSAEPVKRCPVSGCAVIFTTHATPASPMPMRPSWRVRWRSMRAQAVSAAVHSRRRRPATSRPRIWSIYSGAPVSPPA